MQTWANIAVIVVRSQKPYRISFFMAKRQGYLAKYKHGGNFLDTADFYSRWLSGHRGGESEDIIGRWMQRRGNRHEMIIATKVYQPVGEHPNDRGLSRKHLIEALDASLRRLHTDYLDLYLAHVFDAETPIEETLEALNDARRAGKIRYAGNSNYPAWRFVEALLKAEGIVNLIFSLDEFSPQRPLTLRKSRTYKRENREEAPLSRIFSSLSLPF